VPSVRPILVVDDTPANLVAAEVALAPLQRPIVTASSGERALACVLEHDFALILLDVQMPEMDGYETARMIRSREGTQHIPIIFTTAFDHDESSVLRGYALGAVDYLFRPIIPEVLRAKVSVFVALQERTEQLASERTEREVLAAYDRRKDAFIAILAHELRNPLAPVRTCIDLMRAQESKQLDPKLLDILDRQTSLLARLVDDLLDLSRIKADKIELRPDHVDLVDIVESALMTSRPMIDERSHSLMIDVPSARVAVSADAIRLVQVVSNLLNNAARYTPRGGRIEVICGRVDDFGFVRVIDTGKGIPAELQPTIFEMFVQERVASDGSGGLGLGLALSHRLVALHRGTISVSSDGRDRGTTFEIRIPVVSSVLALAVRKRTVEVAPLTMQPPRAIRTVVVDDNDDARELLCELLRMRGYEVLTASDGPTGLRLIRDHRPHVALVDIGLPGMDGISIAEALRRQCPDLDTRLVALTGYGEAADHERTKRAGFHAHLVKPASAAAIFECLAKLAIVP